MEKAADGSTRSDWLKEDIADTFTRSERQLFQGLEETTCIKDSYWFNQHRDITWRLYYRVGFPFGQAITDIKETVSIGRSSIKLLGKKTIKMKTTK